MTSVVNINDVLTVTSVWRSTASTDCLLNAYVPNLQVSGQVVTFLTGHLASRPVTRAAREDRQPFPPRGEAFAAEHDVPVLALKKPDRTRWDDRKLDHVRPYLERAEAEHRTGVVAIVQAQEFQWVFSAKNRSSTPACELRLRERRTPGRDLLLLRSRCRVRTRLHQDLHVLPIFRPRSG